MSKLQEHGSILKFKTESRTEIDVNEVFKASNEVEFSLISIISYSIYFVGGLSLFDFSSRNVLYQLVSGTKVQEHYVDGKRDLEELLRQSCQQFILTAIRTQAESIINFLSKV